MRGCVVDASVAVKWLVDEPLSVESASVLDSGAKLVAPDMLFSEVTNALATPMIGGGRADHLDGATRDP